jgi:hypothetical protein
MTGSRALQLLIAFRPKITWKAGLGIFFIYKILSIRQAPIISRHWIPKGVEDPYCVGPSGGGVLKNSNDEYFSCTLVFWNESWISNGMVLVKNYGVHLQISQIGCM